MTKDIIHGSGAFIFENEKERKEFFEFFQQQDFPAYNDPITEEIEVMEEPKMDKDLKKYLEQKTEVIKDRYFDFSDCCSEQKVETGNTVKKHKKY